MEKELTSCTGVLLRADLTGHGQFSQSADFCQKGQDGRALLGLPSKGRPCRISILVPECSTTFLAPHIEELETYFALLYFWTFAQCERVQSVISHNLTVQSVTLIVTRQGTIDQAIVTQQRRLGTAQYSIATTFNVVTLITQNYSYVPSMGQILYEIEIGFDFLFVPLIRFHTILSEKRSKQYS